MYGEGRPNRHSPTTWSNFSTCQRGTTRRVWVGAFQPSQAWRRSGAITIVRQLVEVPRPAAHTGPPRRDPLKADGNRRGVSSLMGRSSALRRPLLVLQISGCLSLVMSAKLRRCERSLTIEAADDPHALQHTTRLVTAFRQDVAEILRRVSSHESRRSTGRIKPRPRWFRRWPPWSLSRGWPFLVGRIVVAHRSSLSARLAGDHPDDVRGSALPMPASRKTRTRVFMMRPPWVVLFAVISTCDRHQLCADVLARGPPTYTPQTNPSKRRPS